MERVIEKIKTGLEYIADFYRTAPFGETIFLLSTGLIPLSYDKPPPLLMTIFGSYAGIIFTVKQFKLRKRLENSVSKHGYDNRVFKTTILEWCDRQTARVVAKNCGHLDDYVVLCESNRNRMDLPNLGHF